MKNPVSMLILITKQFRGYQATVRRWAVSTQVSGQPDLRREVWRLAQL